MSEQRFTHEDAITLWQVREVSRVQSVLRGLLSLFFVLEFLTGFVVGHWWVGPVLVAIHVALLWSLRWCLRWAMRWVNRGLWWSIDRLQALGGR
jgi:hypothetical protein